MCLDNNGESAYLSTLKKIDFYSVSKDGKTLNLIMGDIAVMLFKKNKCNVAVQVAFKSFEHIFTKGFLNLELRQLKY
jgi:hypothetical protein